MIELVEYESEEYSQALEEAEALFNEKFCCDTLKHLKCSCLFRYEHDGHDQDGVEYAVGLYTLGSADYDEDSIDIGLITDGKGKVGWFYGDEPYSKGLFKGRLIL